MAYAKVSELVLYLPYLAEMAKLVESIVSKCDSSAISHPSVASRAEQNNMQSIKAKTDEVGSNWAFGLNIVLRLGHWWLLPAAAAAVH